MAKDGNVCMFECNKLSQGRIISNENSIIVCLKTMWVVATKKLKETYLRKISVRKGMQFLIYMNIYVPDFTSISPFCIHSGWSSSRMMACRSSSGTQSAHPSLFSSLHFCWPLPIVYATHTHSHMHACANTCTPTQMCCFPAGVWKVGRTKALDQRLRNQGQKKEEESSV